ncbi:MAG TPA: metallophosphoesterase family protein [Candidatus Hydrogenedentes bacterium]|nr:metallophosphoesterase family protein [Candidatus Hydrogenedentota bacterium]
MYSRRFVVTAAIFCVLAVMGGGAAEPLHTYLTYSDDPTTSIDINVFIERKVPKVTLFYDTESRKGEQAKYAQQMDLPYIQTMLEILDGRACYVAALKNLKPNTLYYFVVGDEKYGYTVERSFRTLPGGNAPLRFINGGDMGVSRRTEKLLKLAGEQDPDFGIIGGDIPYSNGWLGEYKDWERWFKNWDKYMVGRDGRMIPIVTAVGNHEVNHYETDRLEIKSPDYLSLFGRQGSATYHSRRFSDDVVFFVLDSGHLAPQDGAQAEWLAQELEKYRDVKYKFACYHVPLYPTHRPYDGGGSELERKCWGPLFDKYCLTVSFEAHDHVFKRSKPLKGNQVVENGTVYVGDGTFGVDPREVDPTPRWYNEKEGSYAHFWLVNVRPEGVALKAIDEDGNEVDAFTLR